MKIILDYAVFIRLLNSYKRFTKHVETCLLAIVVIATAIPSIYFKLIGDMLIIVEIFDGI